MVHFRPHPLALHFLIISCITTSNRWENLELNDRLLYIGMVIVRRSLHDVGVCVFSFNVHLHVRDLLFPVQPGADRRHTTLTQLQNKEKGLNNKQANNNHNNTFSNKASNQNISKWTEQIR